MSTQRYSRRQLTKFRMPVLGILKLKGCPRCKGDIVLERDHWGWYEQCIQCGYLRDLENPVAVSEQSSEAEKKRGVSILRNQ